MRTRSTASSTAAGEAVDLDHQHRRGVEREARVHERLDGRGDAGVHHLDRGGHEASGDDRAHGRGAVVDAGEVEQQRAHDRRDRRQAHGDLRRDAERALAADERAAEVVARGLGLEPAEHRDPAVGQHDLDGQDVGARHAVGEAVRTARVRGDVAADRARLLARRIGREVETEVGDGAAEVEVQDTRLDPRDASVGVDRQDPVHLRRDDHDRVVERHRPAGESRARPAGDERATVLHRGAHARLHLLGREREAHDDGAAGETDASRPYERELERLGAHPVGGERGAEVVDEGVQHRQRSPLVSDRMDDRHEWFSFEDPNEDRTWMFDVTFLLSNWTCIWGAGCQGVLTGPAAGAQPGVLLVRRALPRQRRLQAGDPLRQAAHARAVAVPRRREEAGRVRDPPEERRLAHPARGRRVHLPEPPGLRGRRGLRAPHRRASRPASASSTGSPRSAGSCPIRQVDSTDENGHVTSTVREWKRRDWGEGGFEFHWWCTDAPDAFVGQGARVHHARRRAASRPSGTRSTRRSPSTSTSERRAQDLSPAPAGAAPLADGIATPTSVVAPETARRPR